MNVDVRRSGRPIANLPGRQKHGAGFVGDSSRNFCVVIVAVFSTLEEQSRVGMRGL